MKSLLFGAMFFASIHYGWANELVLLQADQFDPNAVVEQVGMAPVCATCEEEQIIPLKSYTSFDSPPCLQSVARDSYKEFKCGSGVDQMFLYYQFESGPGHKYVDDSSGWGRRKRMIMLNSFEHTMNGTFLTIQDADMSVGASSQMGTDMFLLPRKTAPSVKVIGNEIHVVLQTGEKVVFDKTSKTILSGALKEGAFDIYKPSTVDYAGTGISIRMELRTYDDPRRKSPTANIKQGNKTCAIPRAKLFDGHGIPLTQSDSAFLAEINKACPGKGFTL